MKIALPSTVPGVLAAVRGLLVHEPGSARSATGHLRAAHQILGHILTADPRPLGEPRAPARRLAGCCRHFTVLAVAALRAHGIPARARCGFARYFTPGRYGDHWVVEYWNGVTSRCAVTAVPGTAADSRARYRTRRFRVPPRVYNVLRQADEPVIETV
ncbi:transglutaminase-like domain-containing protein [Jidongwangia harbinensis]|uniref:transglutaminase-like domain-containing protein n=1 Tax=Jidongwangia harbinensis TaxID=2878561 RepID=UPI001CD9DD93|nr:transglutaminase-like domain-containing protein [Jidongwangia harbinensis]MCA2211290.1 transglutaminase-like domain-containing protein [Jidongwangia harbinensis]